MHTRRDFLQKMTGSAIALSLLIKGASAGEPSINEQRYDGPMLRVAIMGLGSYGTRVAEAMKSCTKAKLVGVISGTPAKVKAWQTKYNIPEKNCYNYENFDRIKDNPDIDAVFAASDPMALGALRVLRDAGRRVPEDVAIVGFDDSVLASQTLPTLTSVHQPVEEMGRTMARLLYEKISGFEPAVPYVILGTHLVERDSG